MGSEILSAEGHEVVTVESGDKAVDYLNANRPDLILADTEMPGAGGYDLCGLVRSRPDLENVKVVLLQPPLEPYDERRAAEVGTDGVLHKPLDARALLDTVSSLLGTNGTEAVSRPKAPEATVSSRPAASTPKRASRPADPFAQAVAEALTATDPEQRLREEVHAAAIEVLEAAVPALADRITERALQQLQKG